MLATSTMRKAIRDADREVDAGLRRFFDGDRPTSFLVTAAAGMGKTSFIWGAIQQACEIGVGRVAAISGSVIASEGHFFSSLAAAAGATITQHRRWEDTAVQFFEFLQRDTGVAVDRRLLIVIDDFDRLAFKRERLLDVLAKEVRPASHLMLLATSARATVRRIVGRGRAFENLLKLVILTTMDEREARELVELRSPALPPHLRDLVVSQSGGHPAALVFLSRIADLLTRAGGVVDAENLLARAATLAGEVYAEPWSALGPQQRAILWHVSTTPGQTVNNLANRLFLHSSHVSAQLSRLREEGLVTRAGARGEYVVAPLLAHWILERVIRVDGNGSLLEART